MSSPYRTEALRLHAAGFNPLPIILGTKRPALRGWQCFCTEPMPAKLVERYVFSTGSYGIGLALGYRGLVAIDVDTDDAALQSIILEVLA